MIPKPFIPALAALMLLPGAALAQAFTTAAEVKPILTATKSAWIRVREWDGQDLLYFTHLESWRCGLDAVEVSINGADMIPYELEECHLDTTTPNAITAEDHLPYTTHELGSVQSVTVRLTYDDGTTDEATFERPAILIP